MLSAWALALVLGAHPGAQTAARAPRPAAETASTTARYFASIRNNPSLLIAFLNEMPKGGDLHNHLSGAIYAESYLQWAAADNFCVATATMTIVASPCDAPTGRPPASAVVQDATLYGKAIDAMSMRNWDRSRLGHDQFFNAFAKFGAISSVRTGDMLAEAVSRAAADRVSYLELMVGTDGGIAAQKGLAVGWDPDLPRLRDKMLAANFAADVVAAARQRLDAAEKRRDELLGCGTPKAAAGCQVTVRYIGQVTRTAVPEAVFAQMLGTLEAASKDPRVVGLNLVAPEDALIAVRDFPLHMRMLDYLHGLYPSVGITLHAGELTDGLVPPETLRFHIAESIRTGHARRIGHGVDVMFEDGALDLLKEMAAKRVLVEIALTSNDTILGVKGARHPLRTYLQYGVPVTLATDDLGVARSSMTLEYRKAVEEQALDYPTLKTMARNSIAYSFADAATRKRLETELDAAFRRFESKRRPS